MLPWLCKCAGESLRYEFCIVDDEDEGGLEDSESLRGYSNESSWAGWYLIPVLYYYIFF